MHVRKLAVIGVLLMTLAAGEQETDLPTSAEIQKQIDAGQYQEALRNVTRLLSLKGAPATAYDRYNLLMFRAECDLQLRQRVAALKGFEAARKQAFLQNKPEEAVEPTALAYLIQHSSAYQYTPKTGGDHRPIPILDRNSRQRAYAALLNDELPAALRRLQALAAAKSLTPLLEAAKALGPLRSLELASLPGGPAAATQATLQTDPMVKLITSKAGDLVNDALLTPSEKVTAISAHANELIQQNVPQYDPATKRSWMIQVTKRLGPSGEEVHYLQQTGTLCVKIIDALTEISQSLVTDADPIKSGIAQANTLKMRIAEILNDNYNLTVDRSQKPNAPSHSPTQPAR